MHPSYRNLHEHNLNDLAYWTTFQPVYLNYGIIPWQLYGSYLKSRTSYLNATVCSSAPAPTKHQLHRKSLTIMRMFTTLIYLLLHIQAGLGFPGFRSCLPGCFTGNIVPPPAPRVRGGATPATNNRIAGYIDLNNVPPMSQAHWNTVNNQLGGEQFRWSFFWNDDRDLNVQVRSAQGSLTVIFNKESNPPDESQAAYLPRAGGSTGFMRTNGLLPVTYTREVIRNLRNTQDVTTLKLWYHLEGEF